MDRRALSGWVVALIGIVLVVLGLFVGVQTWDLTIALTVLGLVAIGVGALMILRARRQGT